MSKRCLYKESSPNLLFSPSSSELWNCGKPGALGSVPCRFFGTFSASMRLPQGSPAKPEDAERRFSAGRGLGLPVSVDPAPSSAEYEH